MEQKELDRHVIRKRMVDFLYALFINRDIDGEFDYLVIFRQIFQREFVDAPNYLQKLVMIILKNEQEIISYIEPNLNRWTFSRLNLVVQAILICAVAERNYLKKVDKAVIISESVNIAKSYVPGDDYRFVNGILDKILN